MEKERIAFIDYVRVFACFLVMIVHASENFYPGSMVPGSQWPQSIVATQADRACVSVFDGFSRMAVPLFMIVSAFLLVPKRKDQTAAEFYKRRFGKILPPFLVFAVLYSLLPILWGQLDTASGLHDLVRVPVNFPSMGGHLWFIFPLFGLYLFIPVISPWIEKASAREERFFILLFLISACMPYLNRWLGELWGQCFWNEFHILYYFSGFLGYLVIAHYIREHLDWSTRKRLLVGAPMLVVGAVITMISFYVQAHPGVPISTPVLEVGWRFCSINVVCATIGTFLMFSCIKSTSAPKIIESLSKLSYGMYLMHMFWLYLWSNVAIGTIGMATVLAIPFIAICTFICSAITTRLISLLPGSKWIVGV